MIHEVESVTKRNSQTELHREKNKKVGNDVVRTGGRKNVKNTV